MIKYIHITFVKTFFCFLSTFVLTYNFLVMVLNLKIKQAIEFTTD